MLFHVARLLFMGLLLAGGWAWLEPLDPSKVDPGVRFEEIAQRAGVLNQHTELRVSSRFDNVGPWMSSVGAAVAGIDYDNDGWTDFYVVNSGRGSRNRLFHNRGDGTFE